MNTARALIWVLLLAVGILHSEPSPNLPGGNRIWTCMEDIPGTTLAQGVTRIRDGRGVSEQVSIGYLKRKVGIEATWVEILSLPYLLGDQYTVKFDSGVLRIGTAKTKKEVVAMHLQNICPAVITADVEQSGGDQPATKSTDKAPVNDQPTPPTPQVIPR